MASKNETLHLPDVAATTPPEWSWARLDTVCEGVIDCPHSTPKLSEYGPLMVRSQDMRTGVFRTEKAARVSEATYLERIKRAEPKHGDLVYSREGTYFGIAAEVPPNVRVCLGQRMVLIRPKSEHIHFRFLRYWLNSQVMTRFIHGYRDGTVAERLNMSTIRALPVPIPLMEEQLAIAYILGTLDDKIELNRRMNQTLEAIARAIFKSWFVDFDPVWAKADGEQPVGMDAETAALFPARFVDSELGPIPEGWRVGTVGEIAQNPRRGIKPEKIASDTPYVGLQHMPQKSIALTDWGGAQEVSSSKFSFAKGEILFGKLRPYFHKVGVAPLDGVCSTDVLVVVPKTQQWYGIVLGHLSSVDFVDYTTAVSTGTRMPRTNWRDMAKYEIVIPTRNVALAFNRLLVPLLDAIQNNIFQTQTLAELRDTLLPKLISGQVRVPLPDPKGFENP